MKKYKFNTNNLKYGKAKKSTVLLMDENKALFLGLEDAQGNLTSKIEVLEISKLKKLTNFFMRGFNMPLEGIEKDSMLIPLEDLMEVERKIIVTGENDDERMQEAEKRLVEIYGGKPNTKKGTYPRKMLYLDTANDDLKKNNMVFRLTQEGDVVKATIHMDNNLPGDKKHIIKFFFKGTNLEDVQRFFNEALSLEPVTKTINSTRTEYDSNFGEVCMDKFKDEHAEYSVIELELDSFNKEGEKPKNSNQMTEIAKEIAKDLGLEDCEVVDNGTEAIFEKNSGKPFFEAYKSTNRRTAPDDNIMSL